MSGRMAPDSSSSTEPFTVEALRAVEAELSEPKFLGVPMGPTLNDLLVIEVFNARGDWGAKAAILNRIRRISRVVRPVRGPKVPAQVSQGKILLTWADPGFRLRELVLPVLKELGPARCAVVCARLGMLSQVPRPAEAVEWSRIMQYDVRAWRAEYRKCWPEWRKRLRDVTKRLALPSGLVHRAGTCLAVHSQYVAGCLNFLRRCRPAAIVTEFDRNHLWSCLILAARKVGIPTFTLVHGVFRDDALGFSPLLADKALCWGEMDRRKFLNAGEDPGKLVITGCPRLNRDLTMTPAEARRKVGLDADKPVVMLGTSPFSPSQCLRLAETFCKAVEGAEDFSAVVRLHPSEKLEVYKAVSDRYPGVLFLPNKAWTLEESLAASNVVVVHDSSLGCDALLKRRPVVVLDVLDCPLGVSQELIDKAGCPRAANSAQLAETIRALLTERHETNGCRKTAENYVGEFCAAFGEDAARRTADAVRESIG